MNPVRNNEGLNLAISERHLSSEYVSSRLLSRKAGLTG